MIEEKLISMRRELHKFPEIGGSLPKTKAIVCKRLNELGIPYRENTGDDGIVAEIANYAEKIPGVYFFLHTNNPEKGITEANHNPYFDIDESVLWKGVAAYTSIALKYLG